MEKSMVQELSSLTYSSIFTNRPSFISTHISDPQNNELRKSRISNLPGYRKEDLSAKLNFVVVFQGIEIERLSRQIELLRVKEKDWQRQRHNYQSYEVQIRELSERCHMYELQKEGMMEESDKMKIFCEQLYKQFEEYKVKYSEIDVGIKEKYALERRRGQQLQGQVDKWRMRCTSLERSKGKQLQDMRQHFEAQRKSYINRQIKQITIRFENELQNVGQQLRKAREEIEWKKSQLQRLEHTLHGYEMRQQEIQQIESKMQDYENKFVMASQQNYRLNELLRWKAEQLQRLKSTEQQLRQQIDSYKNMEQTNNKLNMEITQLTQELQEYRVTHSRTSQQLEKLQLQNQKLADYEKLVDQSANEMERLNGIVHGKIKEIDQYKSTISMLENKLSKVSSASQQEVNGFKDRIANSEREIERLTGQLKSRLSQHEALKGKNAELEKRLSRALLIEQENRDLKGEVNQSTRKLQEFKMKITLLQQNVAIVDELRSTLKHDQQFKNELVAQRQRLNETIRNLTLQLETSNEKLSALQNDYSKYSNIQEQLRKYQERWAFMTQQLDRINAEIQLRVGQLYQLRESLKSISNSKNIYQNIQQKLVENMSQMENLILELDNSRRDNEKLENANMAMQMSVRKLQGDIIGANEERTQLAQLLQDKTNEVTRMSQQIEQWASIVSEHRIYQQQNQEYKKKVDSLQSSYNQLETRYHKQIKRSEEYSNQVEQMCSELMQLRQQPTVSAKVTEELAMLRQQSEQKALAVNYLTQRIMHIENILKNLKQKYAMQCQAAQQMKRKAQSVYNKMETLDQVIEMAIRYNQQINKVKEENIQLESHSRLMDIEMCESVKVLEEGQGAPYQQPVQMMTTFGLPQYKNESLADKVSATFNEGGDANIFTFKDMTSQHTQHLQQINNKSSPRNYQQMPSERSFQPRQSEISYQQQQYQPQQPEIIYHQQRQEVQNYHSASKQHTDVSSLNDAKDTTSMASSFIHNLVGRDNTGKYENVGVSSQFQSVNNPNFGKGISVTKLRYVPNSPTNRPTSSHIVSPTNRTQQQDVQFVGIDADNRPPSAYVSNFQQPPRESQSMVLEREGVKRVVSYTHFSGHNQQPIKVSPSHGYQQTNAHGYSQGFQPQQMQQMQQQQPQNQQDLMRIRVLEAGQSHNIANSTNGVSGPLPKRTRLGNDPSPSYQQ